MYADSNFSTTEDPGKFDALHLFEEVAARRWAAWEQMQELRQAVAVAVSVLDSALDGLPYPYQLYHASAAICDLYPLEKGRPLVKVVRSFLVAQRRGVRVKKLVARFGRAKLEAARAELRALEAGELLAAEV